MCGVRELLMSLFCCYKYNVYMCVYVCTMLGVV
jgi:hypothetical protein